MGAPFAVESVVRLQRNPQLAGWAGSLGRAMPYMLDLRAQGRLDSAGSERPRGPLGRVLLRPADGSVEFLGPAGPGWGVGRYNEPSRHLAAAGGAGLGRGLSGVPEPARSFTNPPQLERDLGEYLAGELVMAGRPSLRPHQRDEAFPLRTYLVRLAWEQGLRLLEDPSPPPA
ncbi:hypothetical protein DFAR_1590008 [Desulfarculales bacterium]